MADEKGAGTPIPEMKYEDAAAELEQIIDQLEEGQLTLEQTLILYERGQLLSQHCTDLLNQAELKVRTLASNDQANN